MKNRILAVALLSCSSTVLADLVPNDDLNELSAGESDDGFLWIPEVAVHLGSGMTTMPYGPPGLGQYDTKTRYTQFSLGLSHDSLGGAPNNALQVGLSLKNNFPSAGRQYDLQAVSWIDVTTHVDAVGYIPVWKALTAQWKFGIGASYERFHYPKGLAAIYGVPVRAGAELVWPLQFIGNEVWISAGAQTAYFVFAKTAVKYDSFPVERSALSDRVNIVPNRKVVGRDDQFSLNFSFSTGPVRRSQFYFSEHMISLVWQSRMRNADDYIRLSQYDGVERSFSDLEIHQSSFGLAWTERF